MKLHFVCTGNIFRSRLAEAYAKSVAPKNFIITSSGVLASTDKWGSLPWFSWQVLKDNQLLPFTSTRWTQTTGDLLNAQDFIVFMQPYHLDFCRREFNYSSSDFQVWDIIDINSSMSGEELLSHTEVTFLLLKPKIDLLLLSLAQNI